MQARSSISSSRLCALTRLQRRPQWVRCSSPSTPSCRTTPSPIELAIDRVFGAVSRERILANYPVKSYRLAIMQATTDSEFTCQSRRVARASAQLGGQPDAQTDARIAGAMPPI